VHGKSIFPEIGRFYENRPISGKIDLLGAFLHDKAADFRAKSDFFDFAVGGYSKI